MFAKTLDARGIRYAVNFEGVTVDWLLGDELRLSQIMINFLSNAVKFTEQGEIVVTIRQMMLREGNVDLLLRVHDTGQGMDPNFAYRIFRPFEQESIETGKKYGGTGLGMAITDQLVHLMGGQILVESLPGKGSDFTVYLTLPQAEADEQASVTGQAEDQNQYEDAFQDCRILMAEDNDINAMIAVELLEGMGARSTWPKTANWPWRPSRPSPNTITTLSSWTCRCPSWTAAPPPVPSGPWTGRTPQRSLSSPCPPTPS